MSNDEQRIEIVRYWWKKAKESLWSAEHLAKTAVMPRMQMPIRLPFLR